MIEIDKKRYYDNLILYTTGEISVKKVLKSLLCWMLIMLITAGAALPAFADDADSTLPAFALQAVERTGDLTAYYSALYTAEKYNYYVLRNVPTAFEKDGWEKYCSLADRVVKGMKADSISEKQREKLDSLLEKRNALVQIAAPEDVMWYIWGKSIPTLKETLSFSTSYDNADFKPFLLPYLLEDQSAVKGNLIVVAGGGYSQRSNNIEGYPVAEAFNEKGYNCFVLQRRVSPYVAKEIWLDMQRSIRYVKYKVEELGLGGGNCICATGFSGGSATVLGAIAYCYGDTQPTQWVPGYVPDEIDAINSDLDAALCIYGPNYTASGKFEGLVTENENLPAIFLAAGYLDTTGALQDNITLAQSIEGKTLVENHAFANTPHGFGVGKAGTNSMLWVTLADGFIEQAINIKTEK